jgi:DNA-binding CsgD family transcriptional regulator
VGGAGHWGTHPSISPPPVLERDADLGALDACLAQAAQAGRGAVVVVEGEPGIGKSTLLRHLVDSAHVEGVRVLQARASEPERSYAYGLAIRLFEPLVHTGATDRGALLAGPAAGAARLFDAGDAGDESDPFATVHGLYWLAVNAADAGPLVIALDDAQWADDASLRFLHYLAQRVDDLPILLALAFRTTADQPSADAERLRTDPIALPIRPEPLSENALLRLLEAAGRTDARELAPPRHRMTRGNPFFAGELIRSLNGGLPHRPPESVRRFVERRIGRLDPTARRFAEAVAILGEEATLRRAAALARVDEAAATDLARRLVAAAILDPGDRLAFAHPIVRSAVDTSIPGVARRRAYGDAVGILVRDGAAATVVAAFLLEAEPAADEASVETLVHAAADALGRADATTAVRFLRRALAEPPPPARRPAVLADLARAEAAAGDPAAAERFDAAASALTDPRRRAELFLSLGHTLVAGSDFAAAAVAFERGLAEVRPRGDRGLVPGQDDLVDRLEAGFVGAAWVSMERRREADASVERVLAGDRLGPVNRELAIWIAFQRTVGVTARSDAMLELVRRAISEVPISTLVSEGQAVEVAAGVLLATDALDEEIELLTGAIAALRAAGSYAKLGTYAYCRAWPFFYEGRLTDAIADAQAAIRAAELGWETFFPAACAVLAQALAERGDLEAAEQAIAIDDERWSQRVDFALLVPLVRGKLELARGRPDRALPLIEAASIGPSAIGLETPVPPDWRSAMATALTRLGRLDEARGVADEGVSIARRWGAEWPLGAALRVAGIAHGGRAGLALLEESVARLEGTPARLEHVRALVDLGGALRRHGRLVAAREHLRVAMDLAHGLGARVLTERSRDELVAAGSRPRRYARSGVDALTPSELRVARLAADGRTNREIAQELFVTPKAVEYHLGNVYSKLGITSRQELPLALTASAPEGARSSEDGEAA